MNILGVSGGWYWDANVEGTDKWIHGAGHCIF